MKVVGSLWKVGNLPSHNLKVLFWLQLISMEGGSSLSTFHKQANLGKNIDVQVQCFFFFQTNYLNWTALFSQHFMYIYSSCMLKYQSLTIIEQTQNNWNLEESPNLHKSAPARARGKSISLCSKDKWWHDNQGSHVQRRITPTMSKRQKRRCKQIGNMKKCTSLH